MADDKPFECTQPGCGMVCRLLFQQLVCIFMTDTSIYSFAVRPRSTHCCHCTVSCVWSISLSVCVCITILNIYLPK